MASKPASFSTNLIHLLTVLADTFLKGEIRPMSRCSLLLSVRQTSVRALYVPKQWTGQTSGSFSFFILRTVKLHCAGIFSGVLE
jgi:hypothetical protein